MSAKPVASMIAVTTSLISLNVSHNNIQGSGKAFGKALKTNSSIKELIMRSCELDCEDGKDLASGIDVSTSLTSCNVLKNNLDIAAAKSLVEAVNDKSISLCGIKSDQTKANFRGWGLKSPDAILLVSDLSKAGVSASLTSCNVLFNKMDVATAKSLVEAVEGKRISLAGIQPDETKADFSNKGLKPADAILLASDLSKADVSTSLTTLNVCLNNIKGSGQAFGEALKANSSLKELYMHSCTLNTNDANGLADGLAVHASLTSLDVSKNTITGSGEAFGEALKINSSIKELKMDFCMLNAKDGKGLAAGLVNSASLTKVDLSHNRLCGIWEEYDINQRKFVQKGIYNAEGIIAVADAIGVSASLTEVDLRYNSLGDEGWCAVFDALRENPQSKITKWDLSQQGINPVICNSLAAYMAVSASLTSVNLAANPLAGIWGQYSDGSGNLTGEFHIEGIAAIAQVVKKSTTLQAIDLSNTAIAGINRSGHGSYSAESIMAIAEAVSVSTSITSLDVRYNHCLGDEAKVTIREAVKNKVRFDLKV